MESVIPVNPVAGYVGGKKQLARTIISHIGAIEHELYAEPFVGMGGVFLRRPSRPKVEAINDASQDVATFFRVLQRHYQAFLDMLKWQVTSRAEFARLAAQDPATLTDLERSARFLYLQRLSFGGKVAGRSFGIDTAGPARFDITRLVPMLEAVHERLAGVWIDCLGWEAFIQRWDRPKTLFYLDPPYWGHRALLWPGIIRARRLRTPQRRFTGPSRPLHPVVERRARGAGAVRLGVDRHGRAKLPGRRRGPHEAGAGGRDQFDLEGDT